MKKLFSLSVRTLLLALPLSVTGAALEDNRWNLTDLYQTQAAWDQDAKTLERQFKTLSVCAGQLAQSPTRFQTCLDLNADEHGTVIRPVAGECHVAVVLADQCG